jgi:hypothetical protein
MKLSRRIWALLKGDSTPHDGIAAHYRSYWGADRIEDVHWTPEHLGSRLPDFHIAKVKPARPGGMWTFASIGAWRATDGEPHGVEFVAVSRGQSAGVMRRLGIVAYYHAGPPENRLGAGHLLPIGEGWTESSTLESILVCRPYLWDPKLEHCQLSDRHIQVLWLLPITAAEHDFARRHGVDALEERFEQAEIDYLDESRRSVI